VKPHIIASFFSSFEDDPIERRKPLLLHLTPFSFGSIELRPVAELAGTEVLGNSPDALLDVTPFELERLHVTPNATQRNMYMRVFGIVMSDGDPFEFGTEILFHSLHHIPGKALQIDPESKLRYQFPARLFQGRLPSQPSSPTLIRKTRLGAANIRKFANTRPGFQWDEAPPDKDKLF
jgi:hypothetical protein